MLGTLEAVGAHFELEGAIVAGDRLGRGHIHETHLATTDARARYVLQRLNGHVFRDPRAVTDNIARVTAHQREALRHAGVRDPRRRCLELLASRDGGWIHEAADGALWRASHYQEGTRSVDVAESPAQAREAGRAFGAFLTRLDGLDPDSLAVAIPDFHDLDGRFAACREAARRDARARASQIAAELERAGALYERVRRQLGAPDAAALPRRVVHNDCKLNNLLFDSASGEARCVVDLDTVMEGALSFDFGELVRSACCPAPEDEPRLERIHIDLPLFEAIAAGFLEAGRGQWTAPERERLPWAGAAMSLENALRFFTDHLNGDLYFRALRADHNRDRGCAQLRLAELFAAQIRDLEAALARAARV